MPTHHRTRVLSITRNFVASLPVGVLRSEAATNSSTRVQSLFFVSITGRPGNTVDLARVAAAYRGQFDERMHVYLKFAEVSAWPDSTSFRTTVLPSLPAMRYSPISLGVAITTAELDQGTAEYTTKLHLAVRKCAEGG